MSDAYPITTELLQAVLQIARQAGQAILDIYQQAPAQQGIVSKADDSPLTAADLASHHCIVQGLQAISKLPILSEESSTEAWEVRRAWPRYWLIDPLDGTKEFVKRNGEFTVNIALIEQHTAVLGVVYAPVLQRSYFAARGLGAYRQDGDAPAYPIAVAQRGAVWRVVGSRSHQADSMTDFMQFLGSVDLVEMGSSLKLCLVAEGAADLYPRLAPTSEWDTAAAQCVVEQAGGQVLTPDLQTLLYNSKESILNSHFIVCASQEAAWSSFFQSA